MSTEAQMFTRILKLLSAGVLVLLCLTGAWCHDNGPGEVTRPVLHAGLEDIQITPNAAAAPENAFRKLQLSAWYRGDSNNAVAGPDLTWSLQLEGGSIIPQTGEVTVSAFPAAGSRTGKALVRGGAETDSIRLTLWPNPAAATGSGDVLEVREPRPSAGTARRPADHPSIALLESRTAERCQWGRPLAFLGALSVGEQSTMPCSLALFIPRFGMLFQDPVNDPKWLKKGARLTFAPGKPLPVKVTVFLAVTPPSAEQTATQQPQDPQALPADPKLLAQLDVQRANLILENSRAGVWIDAEYVSLPA
jgi:hypothetical protein